MARTVLMTTDERFRKVADGEWWDAAGIDLVPEAAVDRHLEATPGVVDHGLFPPELVSEVLVGRGDRVERIG